MKLTVLFRCGCSAGIKAADTGKVPPRCIVHGAKIARLLTKRTPVFTGMVLGPCAITKAMEPYQGLIVETPMRLKPQDQKDQPDVR